MFDGNASGIIGQGQVLLEERAQLGDVALCVRPAGPDIGPTLTRSIGCPQVPRWLPVPASSFAWIATPTLNIDLRYRKRNRWLTFANPARDPFALRQHFMLVAIEDDLIAGNAPEMYRQILVRICWRHIVEFEGLIGPAMGAGQIKITLIPALEIIGNRASACYSGCRPLPFLCRIAMHFLTGAGLIARTAASVDIAQISCDLVHSEILDRHHLQAFGRTCVYDLAEAAGETFECRRRTLLVAAVDRKHLMLDTRCRLNRRM